MSEAEPSGKPLLREIFLKAMDLSVASERQAYLERACEGNAALLARIQALLENHTNDDFLEAPAVQVAATQTVPYELPEEPTTECIGRYKLLQKIGEGGCGVVYMAQQDEPVRRTVALKVIKLGMDTKQVIARFEAERQALAMMDHPNIAKVLDAGTTDKGRPYFVMELVRGIKITAYCDQNKLTPVVRLDLFMKVCQAIQHAHQKGIIHRDIKPSNILVTLHDGVPVPKVIDFGIAKATEARLTDKTLFTAFEQFIGTPAYMSPEQAEMSGLDIDTRADIYSLGVLLYELLTGKPPFDGKELLASGLEEMRRTIREREPVRPSARLSTMLAGELTTTAQHRGLVALKLVSLVKGDLDWIVMKALEKDRTRRYETASGLAADLKRYLDSEPVNARPPSTVYKFRKFARRNKASFTAGALVVMALLIGAIVSTWLAVRESRAKTEAVLSRNESVEAQRAAEKAGKAEREARLQADAERTEATHNLYLANMTLAQQAWDENNFGRLRQVLEDTKDSPYRGFEWYYWQRQAHLDSKTLSGRLDMVLSVAYSPTGQRICAGSIDGTAKVWDAATGLELLSLKGHGGWVNCVAFSPDGQRIVTGSTDGTAKVWETVSGRELLTFSGHRAWVSCVAFSPNGERIVTGSFDKTARIWDVATGRELLTFKGQDGEISSVAFAPDSSRIVTGTYQFGFNDHPPGVAKVWETATGRVLVTLSGDIKVVDSVAFSPEGGRIVTGSSDGVAKVWDAGSGRELVTIKGHASGIWTVAFSSDGQRIVTGSEDRTAKVWDAASGRELLMLKGHTAGVRSVGYSPDGQRIVTGSHDKTVKVWDAATGLTLDESRGNRITLKGQTNTIWSGSFSRDGKRIVTGGDDGVARVWDAASGSELLAIKAHAPAVNSVAFTSDGQRIVTCGYEKTAKVWDAVSGRELVTLEGHGGSVIFAAISPDGQRIVTGSSDRTAKVWDAASGRELLTLKGHSESLYSVAFSPDGARIVTTSADNTAKVWEAATGREQLTLRAHSLVSYSATFSPDGQRIVTGSVDQTAKVWDATSGEELVTLKGHTSVIMAMAFSPDGRRIVTGSDDATAKVWEVASGRELLTLKGHRRLVSCVAFSPDGQRILTGSYDGTARVWQAALGEQVAEWQEVERAAQKTLVAMERERMAEEAREMAALARHSIQRWLVLAPIAMAPGQSGTEALDLQQIEGEGQVRPKAGETRTVDGHGLQWRDVALEDRTINFDSILGQVTTQSVAYAVSYLRSEVEQRGLRILADGGLEAKIYLNGKEVQKAFVPSSTTSGLRVTPNITLNAGLNALVLKAANQSSGWEGYVCFTDAQGNPVKGVEVTLDPNSK